MELTTDIREKVGSWVDKLSPYIQSKEFDAIIKALQHEAITNRKTIYPTSKELWNVFKYTPADNLKVLIVGYCPYHTPLDNVSKEGVADGIGVSCSKSKVPQPSLSSWWEGYQNDVKNELDPDYRDQLDLKYLCENGIMMYNCQLSVESQKPGSHAHIWDGFTTWFLTNVINELYTGIPIVFLGTVAAKYQKCIDPLRHYIKVVEHPAASAHRGDGVWKHDKMFSWASKILKDNNGIELQWEKKEPLEKPKTSTWEELANLPSIVRTDINWESDLPWQ